MILGNTIVSILDIDNESMNKVQIRDIIPTYHLDARYNDDYDENGFQKILEVELNDDKLLIKDLDGWSSIISITKMKIPYNRKYYLINNEIIVSEYELLPVYDTHDTRKGFNGATLFKHELIRVRDIDECPTMRKSMSGFDNPPIIEVAHNDFEGFIIKTKSGFYNAGISDYRMNGGINQKSGYH